MKDVKLDIGLLPIAKSSTLTQSLSISNIANSKPCLRDAEFTERRFFLTRTLSLILCQIMVCYAMCLFCYDGSSLFLLLQDGDVLGWGFYISLTMICGILYLTYLYPLKCSQTPFAQLLYLSMTLLFGFLVASVYCKSYRYLQNFKMEWLVIANLNLAACANCGALFYQLMQNQTKELRKTIPYITLLPLLNGLHYIIHFTNCLNFLLGSISLSVIIVYYEMWAIQWVMEVAPFSKDKYFFGPNITLTKMILPCLKII